MQVDFEVLYLAVIPSLPSRKYHGHRHAGTVAFSVQASASRPPWGRYEHRPREIIIPLLPLRLSRCLCLYVYMCVCASFAIAGRIDSVRRVRPHGVRPVSQGRTGTLHEHRQACAGERACCAVKRRQGSGWAGGGGAKRCFFQTCAATLEHSSLDT